MSTKTKPRSPEAEREALRRSERQAAEERPQNFKDAATADKVVEIGPDLQDAPIEGLDPDERSRGRGNTSVESSAGEEDPGAGLGESETRDAMTGEDKRVRER